MKLQTVLIITIVACILFAYRSCIDRRALQNGIDTYNSLVNNAMDSTRHYRDKYGYEHARSEKLIIDKLFLESELRKTADKLNIRPKNIQAISKVDSKTSAQVITIRDTFVDKDLSIYIVKDTVKLSLTDTIHIIDYYRRKWFLGKKRYYIDISNTNSYVRINKITAFEIKGRRKKK